MDTSAMLHLRTGTPALAATLAAAGGQGWRQIGELLLAFALSSVIGLERQARGKSAGLRTQAIVGTASALIFIVSKYGFGDVLDKQVVVLDPSRVAAQIVSGIGFLGAGIIITRRGAIRGLTTAASVWETAAIGMAAGAGLWLLALVVTGLHFVITLAYTPLGRWVSARGGAEADYTITYEDGRGVLRDLLSACTSHSWTVRSLSVVTHHDGGTDSVELVTVTLGISGSGALDGGATLGAVPGVVHVDTGDAEEE